MLSSISTKVAYGLWFKFELGADTEWLDYYTDFSIMVLSAIGLVTM